MGSIATCFPEFHAVMNRRYESLLLDWERRADEGAYQPGIRPDFDAVRKLLNLQP